MIKLDRIYSNYTLSDHNESKYLKQIEEVNHILESPIHLPTYSTYERKGTILGRLCKIILNKHFIVGSTITVILLVLYFKLKLSLDLIPFLRRFRYFNTLSSFTGGIIQLLVNY